MRTFSRYWFPALTGALFFAFVTTGSVKAQDDTPPPPAQQQPRDDGTGREGSDAPPRPPLAGKTDETSKKPASPLDLVMKGGIPQAADKRATLRDDLYALLATAADDKEAKKIAGQIERVWRTTGSDTVSVLMSRSNRAMKAKKPELALTLLDHVVELAPDNAEAWNRRAFAHYSLKNFPSAVGDLRRALALDKNHFKALDGLASIFQQLGDEDKALKVYEQLQQVHPHFPGLDKALEALKGKVEGRGI